MRARQHDTKEKCDDKEQGGGGQAFFRVIISFGLGPPEVAPCMTGTFGEDLDLGTKPALSHARPVNKCQK